MTKAKAVKICLEARHCLEAPHTVYSSQAEQ